MAKVFLITTGLAVVSASVVLSEFSGTHCKFDHQTATSTRVLRAASLDWIRRHPARGCPSLADLRASGELDPGAEATDEWGYAIAIICRGSEVIARSPGRDGLAGTSDDVVAPRGHL